MKYLYSTKISTVFAFRKLKTVLFLCFLFGFQVVNAFNQADSLLQLLKHETDNPKRIEILNQVYIQYDNACKYDSAILIADKILNIAKTVNYQQLATACYKKGKALYNSGRFTPAKLMFNKAIVYALKDKTQINKSQKVIARSYNFLSRVSSREADYKQSINYQKQSALYYAKINELKNVSNANNEIAMQYEALGAYDKALSVYHLNLKYKSEPDCRSSVLQSLQKIAELYAKLYNYKSAYKYLLEGIEYADKVNANNSLVNLYVSTGNLFLNNDLNTDIALSYFFEARKLYLNSRKDADTKKFDLIIGDAYMSKHQDSLALQYYRNVLKINKKSEQHYLSTAYHKIALLYKSNKAYNKAISYFKKGIDNKCITCPDNQLHPSYIELADTYLRTKNNAKSAECLDIALQLALNSKLQYETLISYEAYAHYFIELKKTEQAIDYYTKSLEIAKEIALPEKIINIGTSLSELYFAKADYKKSAQLLQMANALSNKLKIVNQSDQVARLEMKLEMMQLEEKQKLEKMETQNQLKRHRIIFIFSVSGLLLLAVIAFLLYKAYRNKRSDNELLKKQKLEIENMAKQIHENDQLKLRFFTNISHDIRTPLTLIKLPLEKLLNEHTANTSWQKQLELALNNTRKLQQLLNQILDLRKLDDNKLHIENSRFELIQFLTDIALSFEPYCQHSACSLLFKASVSEAIICFDQAKLYAIVNNILSNAFKYNTENGKVWFTVTVSSDHLHISIKDTGKGIDPKFLSEAGTRYARFGNPAETEGSGIGLAYVKELISLLQGELRINSELEQGTTVEISLPLNEISIQNNSDCTFQIKSMNNAFEKLDEMQLTDKVSKPENSVLIVEDNPDLRAVLTDLFKSNYVIFAAGDGFEGKELAFKFQPDCIISDIMMPGLNGIELCAVLKNDIRTSHIPFILLTAKDAYESQLEGYDCGADDYLVKPFDSDVLTRKLKNILKTSANVRKLFSFSDVGNKSVSTLSEIDRQLFNHCRTFIEQHMADASLNVEVLSQQVGLSSKTLMRKFKSLTGKSPADFIRHIRMTHALTLIRDQKLRVNEVALQVGYEDTDRFSKAFKQFHAKAPSAFF